MAHDHVWEPQWVCEGCGERESRDSIGMEGMVTTYDHAGSYAGCIGEETWRRLLYGATVLDAAQVEQVRAWRDEESKEVEPIATVDEVAAFARGAVEAYDRVLALLAKGQQ